MVPPCDPAVVSKRHYHDVSLQMIYVLKGWIKGEYDGQVVTMHAGAAWLQPPRIKHNRARLFRRLRAASRSSRLRTSRPWSWNSACSGEVDTGSPTRACATRRL